MYPRSIPYQHALGGFGSVVPVVDQRIQRDCRRYAQLCPCLFERFVQSLLTEGFEQIVCRVHLKCSERKLVVRRRKNNHHVALDQLQHFKSVQLWHLNVEKQDVRLQFRDDFYGVETVAALGHDVDVAVLRKEFAHNLPRKRLIVDDDCVDDFVQCHVAISR